MKRLIRRRQPQEMKMKITTSSSVAAKRTKIYKLATLLNETNEGSKII